MKWTNRGTLGANLLGHMLAGKSFIRAGQGARAMTWRTWEVIQACERMVFIQEIVYLRATLIMYLL